MPIVLLITICGGCGVQGKAGGLWSSKSPGQAVAVEAHAGTLVSVGYRAKLMEAREQHGMSLTGTFPIPLTEEVIEDIIVAGAHLQGGFNTFQFDFYDADSNFSDRESDFGMFSPFGEVGVWGLFFDHVWVSMGLAAEYSIRFSETPNEFFYGANGSIAIVFYPEWEFFEGILEGLE